MHKCKYINIKICIYIRIYECINMNMNIRHIYVNLYICIKFIYMYSCTYLYVYKFIYMYSCTYLYVYIHTYINLHKYIMYIRKYIYV